MMRVAVRVRSCLFVGGDELPGQSYTRGPKPIPVPLVASLQSLGRTGRVVLLVLTGM